MQNLRQNLKELEFLEKSDGFVRARDSSGGEAVVLWRLRPLTKFPLQRLSKPEQNNETTNSPVFDWTT